MSKLTDLELAKEKAELKYTIYHDFVNTLNKNSIYKSILLVKINNGTAFYECEAYDDAYCCSNDDQFFETCQKIERAFKRYYKKIFEKYNVNNIVVDIYDEWSCNAGLSVYEDGSIDTSNF